MLNVEFVLVTLATVVLLYLTIMDWRFFLLPNKANLALAVLGVVYQAARLNWADGHAIQYVGLQMMSGAVAGAGIFLFTRWFSLKWKGVEGIGWGDVKFSAAAGLWLGPGGVGFMIGCGAALLVIVGFTIVLVTKRPLKDFYLPFGAAACPVMIGFLWLSHFGYLNLI